MALVYSYSYSYSSIDTKCQIQRTPIVNRVGSFPNRLTATDGWGQNTSSALNQPQRTRIGGTHRQPLAYHGGYISDRSDSANEVENFLIGGGGQRTGVVRASSATGGWNSGPQATNIVQRMRPVQRGTRYDDLQGRKAS